MIKCVKGLGGNQGIAGIRRRYNTRVVIWPYRLPKFFLALCFLLCSVLGVCVLLHLLIESDQRSKSATVFWVLGFFGLGISLVSGVTRMDQVSDPRIIFFVFFIFRPGQRLENLISDLKLVCVVSHRSSGFSAVWIRGVGFFWETGGIRLLKAFWVVILLKILCHRSGALTIQVISAFCEWGLGFFVLWEGTNQGGIRMGTAVVFRTLFSALFCFLLFLVLGSSSKPCLSWLCRLEGVSTILATYAVVDGNLGVLMLWGCICPGVIRKEIITVCRTLFSTYYSFWFFLEPYSGNQSRFLWLGWFFLKLFLVLVWSLLSLLCGVGYAGYVLGWDCLQGMECGCLRGNGVRDKLFFIGCNWRINAGERFLWLWESLEDKGGYWIGQGCSGVVLGIGLLMLAGVFGLGCISSFFRLVHMDGEFFDLGLVERHFFEDGHLKDTRERVEASEDGWNEEQFIV
ncbi:hypothetical protein HanPI659440_Chr12g0474431 [Helianthus annuus]|nr:hypothetical protein HanPI659440_Chr12g0474431 [Helianthus annuus]